MDGNVSSPSTGVTQVGIWLCRYPESDDLALLAIKKTGDGEETGYELRDVWFHELSCPGDRLQGRKLFEGWRASLKSERIARLIAHGELIPLADIDQLPHWETSRG